MNKYIFIIIFAKNKLIILYLHIFNLLTVLTPISLIILTKVVLK
jgi:hypothetical protein